MSLIGYCRKTSLFFLSAYRLLFAGRALEGFIGRDPEVVERGSPRRRAAEIQVPALLFHGKKDLNVPFDHSKVMKKALRKAKKEVELVEYEGVAHSIDREEYRIDMLTRIGVFLDENLAPRATASVGASD